MKTRFLRFTSPFFIILFLLTPTWTSAYKQSSFQEIVDQTNRIGTWIQMIGNDGGKYPSGFGVPSNFATRGIEEYRGELFIGTQNANISKASVFNLQRLIKIYILIFRLCDRLGITKLLLKLSNIGPPIHGSSGSGLEIWKFNYTIDTWTPFISNAQGSVLPSGFGDRNNFAAAVIRSFKGDLYIGTASSSISGCELWRWDGETLEQVMQGGFGDRFNSGIWCIEEYNDELYVGTMNWKAGCQIWKTIDGMNWEKVLLPGGDGFGTNWNVYAWSMGIYRDILYVGTCNIYHGCQLYGFNGMIWFKINLPHGDGFGEQENYGIRNILEYNGELYIATATNYIYEHEACELWKYNGTNWSQIIGEDGVLGDGFGDLHNKYAWAMIVSSNNQLIVGTFNAQPILGDPPVSTTGCEIWRFDGIQWETLVGDFGLDKVKGGFDNRYNVGARSMIEYPHGSGILWVGTFTMDLIDFQIFSGCEIWKRTFN